MTDTAILTSFLFTDIEGSSLKWLNHRSAMQGALSDHDRILREAIAAYEGDVFKTAGDAFLAAFRRPSDAVNAAIAAQKNLAAHDWSSVAGLKVRMAVHCGTAEKREGDYFGPALNRCARLLSLAHGGQVLATSASAELVAAEREVKDPLRLIGTHPLDDPAQPVGIHQVLVEGLPQDFPPLRTAQARLTNLPNLLTSLIGREAELQTVKSLIAAHRLVTLTGPGGVGKTRLALEAGAEQLANFAHGVWLVELAPLSDPNLVASAVAATLGIDTGARPVIEVLANQLRTQDLLIILDNCEHVIAAVAELSEALLSRVPGIRFIVSTQELIGLTGEQVFRVPSLSLPQQETPTVDEALASGAVKLFVERARAADAHFIFDLNSLRAATNICRRLDGVALAIEMAAARAPMLGLDQLAQGLDARFRVLTGGKRTAVPRQRTLHATLDWSHGLLSESERIVFRRLAVFSGGFAFEAMKLVISDEAFDEFEVIDHLSSLVSKSLVVAEATRTGRRYRLLETTRAYAQEKLAEAGEVDSIARRHATTFRTIFERGSEEITRLPTAAWNLIYAVEIENLRTALDWAFGVGGDEQIGIALTTAGVPVWSAIPYNSEMVRWLQFSASKLSPETPPQVEAGLRMWTGYFLHLGAPTQATEFLDRAASIYRQIGDETGLLRCLVLGAFVTVSRGQFERTVSALSEAKPLLDRPNHERFASVYYYFVSGTLHALRGDAQKSMTAFNIARARAQDAGMENITILCELEYARAHWILGDANRSEAAGRDIALQIEQYRGMGRTFANVALCYNAFIQIEQGNCAEALIVLREFVSVLREMVRREYLFDHLAARLAKTGHVDSAARVAGAADLISHGMGEFRAPPEQRAYDSTMVILRAKLLGAELERLMAEGARMSEENIFALAVEE